MVTLFCKFTNNLNFWSYTKVSNVFSALPFDLENTHCQNHPIALITKTLRHAPNSRPKTFWLRKLLFMKIIVQWQIWTILHWFDCLETSNCRRSVTTSGRFACLLMRLSRLKTSTIITTLLWWPGGELLMNLWFPAATLWSTPTCLIYLEIYATASWRKNEISLQFQSRIRITRFALVALLMLKREWQNLKCTIIQFHIPHSCLGDRGTPLMGIAEINGKPRIFQHGIVSGGQQCNEGQSIPELHTSVNKYMLWILDNMTS